MAAAKAGLEIVCGAAGNSWMFGDQGKRMIAYSGVDEGRKKKVMRFRIVTLLHLAHLLLQSLHFFLLPFASDTLDLFTLIK